MKKEWRFFFFLLLCLMVTGRLQAQSTHWQYDPYAYQYDMTAYVALSIDGTAVGDYSDYEIAAFCNDECRGIAEIRKVEKDGVEKTYGYMRIRSNEPSGEAITFKVCQLSTEKEMDVHGVSIDFQSQQLVGLPSNPLLLNVIMIMKGDVNGDKQVDTQDAIKVIQYYLGKQPEGFIREAADVTGDGMVDTQDAIQIIKTYLNK